MRYRAWIEVEFTADKDSDVVPTIPPVGDPWEVKNEGASERRERL